MYFLIFSCLIFYKTCQVEIENILGKDKTPTRINNHPTPLSKRTPSVKHNLLKSKSRLASNEELNSDLYDELKLNRNKFKLGKISKLKSKHS